MAIVSIDRDRYIYVCNNIFKFNNNNNNNRVIILVIISVRRVYVW